MKVYLIIISIVAVVALGLAGYFYWQGGDMRQNLGVCQGEKETLKSDKDQLEGELSATNGQLAVVRHSATALNLALNSFMFAGDVRALTVGSKESAAVEQAIGNLDDSGDRMTIENNWTDFKNTRYLNPLLGVLRTLANGIERIVK